jgi:hypothetical protein
MLQPPDFDPMVPRSDHKLWLDLNLVRRDSAIQYNGKPNAMARIQGKFLALKGY